MDHRIDLQTDYYIENEDLSKTWLTQKGAETFEERDYLRVWFKQFEKKLNISPEPK